MFHRNIWLICFLLQYCDSTEDTLCCRFLYTTYPMATFHITFMATSFIVPLVLISGLYIRMIIRLWTTVVGNKLSTESQKGRKRVTRLVVVVVVAFASLWFPIQVRIYYIFLRIWIREVDIIAISTYEYKQLRMYRSFQLCMHVRTRWNFHTEAKNLLQGWFY